MSFFTTQPFLPRPLPPADLSQSEAIQKAVFRARLELAELNGYAHAIPNPLLLMSPWVVREAVASSEIENINTTILLALQNQLLPQDSRSGPDKEVLRYRDAMIWGYENMAQLPLSGRLIRDKFRQELPALFSMDLTDELFSHPVITAPKLAEHLSIHRSTALRYLHALAAAGFLQKRQEGKRQFYLHLKLLDILSQ